MLDLPLQEKVLQGSNVIVVRGESRAEEETLNSKSTNLKSCSAGYNMNNKDLGLFFRAVLGTFWSNILPSNRRHSEC